MIRFTVNDMTCGHCAATITKAVKSVDPQAEVHIDLPTHQVEIDSGTVDAPALSAVIAEAGYTPEPA